MPESGGAALLSLIREARHCAALTGAGLGALSGIPDFRGAFPAELLRRFSPAVLGLYLAGLEELLPERAFDFRRFEEDPSFFYRTAGPLVYGFHRKEPNVVHRSLAELESRGLVGAVITQNIDMLHQKAGSRRVIELHGSPAVHYCLRCPGIRVGYDEAAGAFRSGGTTPGEPGMPRCPRCGGVLKPALAFYGELLPLAARRAAEEAVWDADLLLILGTSLSVYPAADLPRTVLRRGGKLAIVNRQDTALDGLAALRLRELEDVFGELAACLDG